MKSIENLAELLFKFIDFLDSTIEEEKCTLHFLTREGIFLYDFYKKHGRNFNQKTCFIVPASRKACIPLAVFNEADIVGVASHPSSLTSNQSRLIHRYSLGKAQISNLQILKDIESKRSLLQKYYLTKFPSLGKKNSFVVDIGYRGSIQDSLTKMLNNELKGLYLFGAKKFSSPQKKCLISFLPKGLIHDNILLFEWLFTYNVPSFLGVYLDNNQIKEDWGEVDISIRNTCLASEHIRSRVLDEKRKTTNLLSSEQLVKMVIKDTDIIPLLENNSCFEDDFSGPNKRHLLSDICFKQELKPTEYYQAIHDSGWSYGAKHIMKSKIKWSFDVNNRQVSKSNSKKKLMKFIKNPVRFLVESKYKFVHYLGASLLKLLNITK